MIQCLMCLCYLPANKIQEVFEHLKENAPKELDQLFSYVGQNWIYGKRWSPESWSAFYVAIRTNNDAEGLHRAWNEAAGRKLQFYRLAEFLRFLG
jgi:hypothetical protein